MLPLFVPWPVLDPTATAESEIEGANVLTVRKFERLSAEDHVFELLLPHGVFVVDPLEVIFVLRIQLALHTILEREGLVTADNQADHGVDEADHTTDQRESLVERLNRVRGCYLFTVLDHANR